MTSLFETWCSFGRSWNSYLSTCRISDIDNVSFFGLSKSTIVLSEDCRQQTLDNFKVILTSLFTYSRSYSGLLKVHIVW